MNNQNQPRPLLDPDKLYGIDDENSNQLSAGLSGREVYTAAQKIADGHGKNVYVYALDPGVDPDDGEPYVATETILVSPTYRFANMIERGNGFPEMGDYVCDSDGDLWRVIQVGSRITTDHPQGNLCHNYRVVPADWDDCPEGEDHSAAIEWPAD